MYLNCGTVHIHFKHYSNLKNVNYLLCVKKHKVTKNKLVPNCWLLDSEEKHIFLEFQLLLL